MTQPVQHQVLRAIGKRYGLQIRKFKSYSSLYRRSAAFRVTVSNGERFLIKPFYRRPLETELSTKQQMTRVISFVRMLQESGYPHMPDWLATPEGRYWVSRNSRPYYVTRWLEGRAMQPTEQDYAMLGSALAVLHTCCKDSLPAATFPFSRNQISLFQAQERLFRRRLAVIRRHWNEQGRWFDIHGPQCLALTQEAWAIMDSPEVAQIIAEEVNHPVLIHGDVTVPNILFSQNRAYLIDWDYLRMDSIYYEIAKTLLNTGCYNPLLMQALLNGYEQFRPLRPAERLLISGFFRIPREALDAARFLASGRGGSVFRVLQRTWQERLQVIQWMDEWACRSYT